MVKELDPAIERLKKAARLSAEARKLFLGQLRIDHPELSEPELKRLFLKKIYRDDPAVLELIERD